MNVEPPSPHRIVVIGGGAAGVFAAISCSTHNPSSEITILEAGAKPLAKVKISGGGRCNVTHHCFEPRELVKRYPRGAQELLGPFHKFNPANTIEWFNSKGVELKTESDGRMFPTTDSSQTIIDTLIKAAADSGVKLSLRTKVAEVTTVDSQFRITLQNGESLQFDRLIVATGSASIGHKIATSFGHTITELAPSLFTFEIHSPLIDNLSGISFPNSELQVEVSGKTFREAGPTLITHWGLSGPAVLRLSAWAARELAKADYKATLKINWVGTKAEELERSLKQAREESPKRTIANISPTGITRRFWERAIQQSASALDTPLSSLSNQSIKQLVNLLTQSTLHICGKGEFKEEFVTCGGVKLSEVDFRTMESKLHPGLYFAGEVLDIDGITGGFNFQAAWTTGWLAGAAAGKAIST